jgi:hypothetical protein
MKAPAPHAVCFFRNSLPFGRKETAMKPATALLRFLLALTPWTAAAFDVLPAGKPLPEIAPADRLGLTPFLSYGRDEPAPLSLTATAGKPANATLLPREDFLTPGLRAGWKLDNVGAFQWDWMTRVYNTPEQTRQTKGQDATSLRLNLEQSGWFWRVGDRATLNERWGEIETRTDGDLWTNHFDMAVGKRFDHTTVSFDLQQDLREQSATDSTLSAQELRTFKVEQRVAPWLTPYAAYKLHTPDSDPLPSFNAERYDGSEWQAWESGLSGKYQRVGWKGGVELKDTLRSPEESAYRLPTSFETWERLQSRAEMNVQVVPKSTQLTVSATNDRPVIADADVSTGVALGVTQKWTPSLETTIAQSIKQTDRPTGFDDIQFQSAIQTQIRLREKAALLWRFEQNEHANERPTGTEAGVERALRLEMRLSW